MEQFKLKVGEAQEVNKNALRHMSLAEWTGIDKASLGTHLPQVFQIEDECAIDEIIRPPNADDGDINTILKQVNGTDGQATTVVKAPWGWLIQIGEIMFLNDNGKYCAVGPGRWFIKPAHYYFTKRCGRKCLKDDVISVGNVTIVRVRRGQFGLAVENGRPVLLHEGLHAYNNPLFSFVEFKSVASKHVQHVSYHVVRVPRGQFGKIYEQNRAKLLPEGTHTVNNAVFEYCGLADSIESYINHGTIHVIQVPKGYVGLVTESSFPRVLSEGVHIYDSATLTFFGSKSMLDPQIIHGTISRFRVQKGDVGLAWPDNEPMLIEDPGTYSVDSPSFRFVSLVNVSEKTIALGAKKLLTVNAGEVAVTFKAGTLTILQPGRHYIDAVDHIFDGFISTQQLSLRLAPGNSSKELLNCETKDLVNIGIRADVFYRIKDPIQAIMQVGREFIPELVKETSIATLNNIIRSTVLSEIAQSPSTSAQSEKNHAEDVQNAQAMGHASAPLFFDKAHDAFLAKLHDDFIKRYGLEITNIRIEQFKIMDAALAQSISGQAVKTAETQSQLANLEGQTQIATQQQERDVRVQQLAAEAEAKRIQIKADSEKAQAEARASAQKVRSDMEANTKRTEAQAEADSVRLKAQAQADAVKIQAEATVSSARAEAEAITMKAKAEAERAKLLAATPLGEKLSLLQIYGDVVKKSNEGVEKVLYMDPTTMGQGGNPLSLLTLGTLQSDMASLSATGSVTDARPAAQPKKAPKKSVSSVTDA